MSTTLLLFPCTYTDYNIKTMVPLWSLDVVFLLTAQTVVGFGMLDVLRGSRQIKGSQRDVMTPADVIVGVILEEADANDDQQITLAEVGTYFEDLEDGERGRFADEKGYVKALATVMDADQSGIVEFDELQRAAIALVNNTGTQQVGRFVETQVTNNLRTGRFFPLLVSGVIAGDFLAALDTNHNGLVSTEEREQLLGSRRFQYRHDSLRSDMEDADKNGDENLDQSEVQDLLWPGVGSEHRHIPLKCYIYARIWKLAGADLANDWLNSWYR